MRYVLPALLTGRDQGTVGLNTLYYLQICEPHDTFHRSLGVLQRFFDTVDKVTRKVEIVYI